MRLADLRFCGYASWDDGASRWMMLYWWGSRGFYVLELFKNIIMEVMKDFSTFGVGEKAHHNPYEELFPCRIGTKSSS